MALAHFKGVWMSCFELRRQGKRDDDCLPCAGIEGCLGRGGTSEEAFSFRVYVTSRMRPMN